MRKIFEWVGGFALIAFSFYFTDKVSLLVANKSDLMQEIKSVSDIYETKPVDAIIDDEENSIIPGKFGRVVNGQESYLQMHDFGSFNENYLIFDDVKPTKSLEDNKDKFITRGNSKNRFISFIVKENAEVEKYFTELKIEYDKVATKYETPEERVELINGAKSREDFNSFNSKLDSSNKICLKEESDIDLCKKSRYYLVDAKNKLSASNLIDIKNSIATGEIILITSSAKLEDVKLLLKEIDYKDLDIVILSKLISEK